MSIRWNIRDRATGEKMVVHQPTTRQQSDNLSSLIKHCSSVGISEQGREMAKLHNKIK